jgi:hypothetical protein
LLRLVLLCDCCRCCTQLRCIALLFLLLLRELHGILPLLPALLRKLHLLLRELLLLQLLLLQLLLRRCHGALHHRDGDGELRRHDRQLSAVVAVVEVNELRDATIG